MWNLMIVEDEAIVRLGLKSMNVWQKHQVNWAIEASNGEEALEKGGLEDIHILITDIRMPRVNGIQLATRIRELNRSIQIIFLSSYDDFDYVKKALQIGAVDYLHKPTMDEDDISQVLGKAIINLESIYMDEKKGAEFLGEKEKNYFLLTMIDRYTRPVDWQEKWERYELPKSSDCFLLVRVRIADQRTSWKDDTQSADSLYYSVRHFIEEYLKKGFQGVVFTRGFCEIIILLSTPNSDQDTIKSYMNKMMKVVQELLNVEMYYSCSQFHSHWEHIPDAYLEALIDTPVSASDYSPIIKKAYECMKLRYCEELSLSSLAGELHISVSYLSRQFSKEVGDNFIDVLTRMRMDHAKKMLRETNMKVYEISEQVGYRNSHYFSRLFKEIIGVTPMEYRGS